MTVAEAIVISGEFVSTVAVVAVAIATVRVSRTLDRLGALLELHAADDAEDHAAIRQALEDVNG